MRYLASEKLEIIRLVEPSHLPAKILWTSSASHVQHSTDLPPMSWSILSVSWVGNEPSGCDAAG
jgi:hypothetical protein